jgi:tRNA(fMet)-specific endonuclease VapC
MIVLDTDIISIVLRNEGHPAEVLESRLDATDGPICIAIVSVEEQLRGWLSWIAGAKTTKRLVEGYSRLNTYVQDLEHFEILDFDEPAADKFQELRKSRVRIGTLDLRIASIALLNDATLVSRNLIDMRKVPGLRVEDWTLGE